MKTPQPYTTDAHNPHLGTDNVGGQISFHIFLPNRGYCLFRRFWRSYLTGRVWLPFPNYDREFDMETDVFA